MDKIYKTCIEMGADALTQMEFEYYQFKYPNTFSNNVVGIKISGFTIKRK